MPCEKDHSHEERIIEALPDSQRGKWRHKCAACAYDAGYKCGCESAATLTDEQFSTAMDALAWAKIHWENYSGDAWPRDPSRRLEWRRERIEKTNQVMDALRAMRKGAR